MAGRYLYVNPTCARIFGAAAEQVVGTDADKWFGSSVGAELRAEDRAAIERGAVSIDQELEIAGMRHQFSTSKVPFRDRSGRVLGVVGIARDVDENRRAADAIATTAVGSEVTVTLTQENASGKIYPCVVEVEVAGATETTIATIDFGPDPKSTSASAKVTLAEPVVTTNLDPKHKVVARSKSATPLAKPTPKRVWIL